MKLKIRKFKSADPDSVGRGIMRYWNDDNKALSYLRGRCDPQDSTAVFLKQIVHHRKSL